MDWPGENGQLQAFFYGIVLATMFSTQRTFFKIIWQKVIGDFVFFFFFFAFFQSRDRSNISFIHLTSVKSDKMTYFWHTITQTDKTDTSQTKKQTAMHVPQRCRSPEKKRGKKTKQNKNNNNKNSNNNNKYNNNLQLPYVECDIM